MMPEKTDRNEARLRGWAAGEAELSHRSHGEVFYRFPLSVPRLSGINDVVTVTAPGRLLELCPVERGDELEVTGAVRTYNNRTGVGNRLIITVYAHALSHSLADPENQLKLRGTICRPPTHRFTPLGREICDMILAVNRSYGRSDYLPCIAWGSLAGRCARLEVGRRLELTGRLQSRIYHKETDQGSQERTAYEVSVMELEEAQ